MPSVDIEPKAAKPARKTAAKAVAKKAPAKKAAKKISKRVTSPDALQENPASSAADTEPKAARTSQAPEQAAESIPAPKPIELPFTESAETDDQGSRQAIHHSPANDAPRMGRVPGGGPVNPPPVQQISHPQADFQSPPGESRSKKRREKRKRRRDNFGEQNLNQDPRNDRNNRIERNDRRDIRNKRDDHREPRPQEDRSPAVLSGPLVEADGILELTPKGFGFLRMPENNFEQAKEDIFISPELIRRHSLRHGQWLHGQFQASTRGPQLIEIKTVNGEDPATAAKFPHFDELKAINPNKRIAFETTPDRYTTRVVDIVAPVGRGQRGLIVSPPRSGKTTLLLHMAEAIREKYDEQIHLMILLVDERPEEVTEFRRALPGAEIYASSNDEQARNHTRIAELAIERAKRLVEAGKDVFLLMDSITRLARAYNGNMNNRGRGTGSGGLTIGALEIPRRLFAAARNTRGGGSLTILATALIQTNSRADEAIYMEFKGTGNMELVLDRKIAENYIYPAVDIFKSGTRREELLLPEHTLHKIHLIRRGLSGHRPVEAMERLLYFVKKFPNNPQMLLEIKG
ncbi:MAG: transcription termination factor Rho [Armatimonadetes bacterium]|nr:transcription termination factor Rho [Akkermansiaceae bacterium]